MIGRGVKWLVIKNFQYATGWHFFVKAKGSLAKAKEAFGDDIILTLTDRSLFRSSTKMSLVPIIGLAGGLGATLMVGAIYTFLHNATVMGVIGGVVWCLISLTLFLFCLVVFKANSRRGFSEQEAKSIISFVKLGAKHLPATTKEKAALIGRTAEHHGQALKRIGRD